MAFRFSLAAVLTYREALEQRELAALERAQQEIALLETQIRDADADLRLLEQRRHEDLRRGLPSIHLQEAIEREQALLQLQKDLEKKNADLKAKRLEILKTYEEARQKRELLEKLRDRRRGEYSRSQARAEQTAIDDLFLSRWKPSQ
jgi:flagellar FliJ protein